MSVRDPRELIRDMTEFAKRAQEYALQNSPDAMAKNHLYADALLRVIGMIGEASTRLP